MIVLVEAAMGALAAAAVTAAIYDGPFWGKRIGSTQFRRANLPVGGLIASVVGLIAPTGGDAFLAAGIAAGVVAVAWRWIDPLPPVGTC